MNPRSLRSRLGGARLRRGDGRRGAGFPRLLAAVLVATVALVFAAPTQAQAKTRFCGSVTVNVGGDESGGFGIRAEKIKCQGARRLVRVYLRTGNAPGPWAVRTNPSSYTMYKGKRQITFRVAS
jgi:hypothetical protein